MRMSSDRFEGDLLMFVSFPGCASLFSDIGVRGRRRGALIKIKLLRSSKDQNHHVESVLQVCLVGRCNKEMGMDRIGNALQAAPIVLWLAMLSYVAPCLAQTSPDAATTQAARTLATSICGSCHGLEGRSTDPAVPIIAGQPQTYIEVQLQAFRAHSRRDSGAHEYMRLTASAWLTNDQIITGIASYFSSQAPAPGKPGDPAVMAKGKQLYQKGSYSSYPRILPCSDCHGDNAQGIAIFPRLAGQHAEYLVRRMQSMREAERASRVMHSVIPDLSDTEMIAVATYLQSK